MVRDNAAAMRMDIECSSRARRWYAGALCRRGSAKRTVGAEQWIVIGDLEAVMAGLARVLKQRRVPRVRA